MKEFSLEKIIQYKRLIRKLREKKGEQVDGKVFVRKVNCDK